MGCCCSCLEKDAAGEAEMTKIANPPAVKSLSISRAMSAPTIELEGPCQVSGSGLALCGCSIEQDAAYWEWLISSVPEETSKDTMFGVATRKNSAFYKSLDDQSGNGASIYCPTFSCCDSSY
jgi:hypothetical protein